MRGGEKDKEMRTLEIDVDHRYCTGPVGKDTRLYLHNSSTQNITEK